MNDIEIDLQEEIASFVKEAEEEGVLVFGDIPDFEEYNCLIVRKRDKKVLVVRNIRELHKIAVKAENLDFCNEDLLEKFAQMVNRYWADRLIGSPKSAEKSGD